MQTEKTYKPKNIKEISLESDEEESDTERVTKQLGKLISDSESDGEMPAKRRERGLSPVKPEPSLEVDSKIRRNILQKTCKNNSVIEKLPVKRNMDIPSTQKKSFAEVTRSQVGELHVDLDMLKKLQEEVVIDGSTAIMDLIEEEMEEEKRKMVTFRTYSNRTHKID